MQLTVWIHLQVVVVAKKFIVVFIFICSEATSKYYYDLKYQQHLAASLLSGWSWYSM